MGLQIAGARVVEAEDGALGEENGQEAGDVRDLDGTPRRGRRLAQAGGEPVGDRGEA